MAMFFRKRLSLFSPAGGFIFFFTLAIAFSSAAEPEHPQGELSLRRLSDHWYCLFGDYTPFLKKEIIRQYGEHLYKVRHDPKVPWWSKGMWVDFSAINTLLQYRPEICRNWSDSSFFTLKTNSPSPLMAEDFNDWLSASEQFRYAPPTEPEMRCNSAAVFHTAYFKLSRPLKSGETLSIYTKNGEKASYTRPAEIPVSPAIKYNQLGTLAENTLKFAYVGLWLGPGKHLDIAPLCDTHFQLKNSDGKTVFEAPIRFRSNEQYYTGADAQNNVPLNGESVAELDFSSFNIEGTYYLEVPGVGRTDTFKLGNDPIGEAFYTHMRGLYHQRCGIAKTPEHTPWSSETCHVKTYQAHFSPDESDCTSNSNGTGAYYDDSGKRLEFKHFEVISATKTDTVIPGLCGGWHDAADYDRRNLHLPISGMLLNAFQLFPENFTDEQLNIPESGNGIPDIVDEAAWGLDVWRKAQRPDGGVGIWIEAESHPFDENPVTDTQRYYLARPTRAGSFTYAAYAAMLGNVYKQLHQEDSAHIWQESAERAWRFAINPKNRFQPGDRFFMPKRGWVHYVENEKIEPHFKVKAAINLFLLTGKKVYKESISKEEIQKTFAKISYPLGAWYLAELLTNQIDFPAEKAQYTKIVCSNANEIITQMETHAYRTSHFPPNHGYFTYLSWGNTCPMNRGAFLIMAYQATGRYRYRDKALLLNDWMLGANPLSRSMTSGLGKRYPVRFLSLQSYADGIEEFRPGITPYTYMYHLDYEVSRRVYSIKVDPRPDHNFPGCDVSMLTDSFYGGNISFDARCKKLSEKFPVWRRMGMLEAWTVKQSEFTVWETIAPSAAALGTLMKPGWKPSKTLKQRQPKTDIRHSESFLYQP